MPRKGKSPQKAAATEKKPRQSMMGVTEALMSHEAIKNDPNILSKSDYWGYKPTGEQEHSLEQIRDKLEKKPQRADSGMFPVLIPEGVDSADLGPHGFRKYSYPIEAGKELDTRLQDKRPGMAASDEDNLTLLPTATEAKAREYLSRRKTKKELLDEKRKTVDEALKLERKSRIEERLKEFAKKAKEEVKKKQERRKAHGHLPMLSRPHHKKEDKNKPKPRPTPDPTHAKGEPAPASIVVGHAHVHMKKDQGPKSKPELKELKKAKKKKSKKKKVPSSSSSSSSTSSSEESSSSSEETETDSSPPQNTAYQAMCQQYQQYMQQCMCSPPPCPEDPCKKKHSKSKCNKPIVKKEKGLDFEFRPASACCTEVTFTIEPDEDDPIQFALDNGIAPYICCMLPPCLMVLGSQGQGQGYGQQQQGQSQGYAQQQRGQNYGYQQRYSYGNNSVSVNSVNK